MTFPQTILPLVVEAYISGAWTDITGYVQSRNDIAITRGLSNEASSMEPAGMTLTLNNRDGRFSPRNPTGPYYGLIGRNTPIRCSIAGPGYAQVTQQTATTVGTCYVSTTDKAALDITGNIDLRFDADLVSWRDAMELVSKWTQSGNQRSYMLVLSANGTLNLFASVDGATSINAPSTVPVPVVTGRLAVRATLNVSTGGNHVWTYYTSDSLAGTWVQLGDTVTVAGTTSIFSSTAIVALADNPNDAFIGSVIHGRIYGAEIRNGIGGTVVANPDFTALSAGTTSFADGHSNTWTVNSSLGSLVVMASDPRFIGEVTAWPQMWDTSGKDVWVPLECADITRRLGQGAQPLGSAIFQTNANNTALVNYWPCEDGASATSVASALVNGQPLRFRGTTTPTMSTNTSFVGSKPVLNFNAAELNTTIAPYASTGSIQIRMLLSVPAGGTVNGSSIIRVTNAGTIPIWALTYGSGGTLTLTARDASDVAVSVVFSGVAYSLDGRPVWLSLELKNVGSNVTWNVDTIDATSTAGGGLNGTLSSFQIGRATKLEFNHGLSMLDVGAGHITFETAITTLYTSNIAALNGYSGETAGARISRLCASQGVQFQTAGYHSAATMMGPQPIDTFLNLVQDAVLTDGGQLFTPKDWLALAYRPAAALYGQPADVTLDYSAHQLDSLQPTEDDQNVRNDVTVTRTNGSSFRATDTTSVLSVLAPPLGVGTYDTALTLNLASDSQVADQAGWRVHVGTVNEARYPVLSLNLAAPALSGTLSPLIAALDIGSRVVVTHPPAWIPPDDISQAVIGYTETLSQYTRSMVLNCRPSSPFDTAGIYGSSYQASRYSPDSSVLAAGYTSSATSFSVTTTPLWTTTDVPFDILVAGERITVTAVSGASSPQVFTVTRSVNGVVKAQLAGAAISLFAPAYYVL